MINTKTFSKPCSNFWLFSNERIIIPGILLRLLLTEDHWYDRGFLSIQTGKYRMVYLTFSGKLDIVCNVKTAVCWQCIHISCPEMRLHRSHVIKTCNFKVALRWYPSCYVPLGHFTEGIWNPLDIIDTNLINTMSNIGLQ